MEKLEPSLQINFSTQMGQRHQIWRVWEEYSWLTKNRGVIWTWNLRNSSFQSLYGLFRGFPGGSDDKEDACHMGDPSSIPELERFPGERHSNSLQYSCLENSKPGRPQSVGSQGWAQLTFWAFQVALVIKFLLAGAGDTGDAGSIPGLGRSPGEGNGDPVQYSCLENAMVRETWWAMAHRVAESHITETT